MADELLTTREVAELLRIDPVTVRLWADDGRLPVIVLPGPGRRRRYPKAAIEALLKTGTPGSTE